MIEIEEKIRSLDWAEKYRPKTLSQIYGNNKAIEELRKWALKWVDGIPDEKVIIVHGKPGIGKTASAHSLANDMEWEIVELNASDQRTADIINKIVGLASINKTFDDRRRLIILDEADNLHGTADKGGEKAIIDIISRTMQPMILIANEVYKMSPGLRKSCRSIIFKPLITDFIVTVLKKITDTEGITCENGVLENLAFLANGDMRRAINDLQAIGQEKTILEKHDIKIAERDSKNDKFNVVKRIFNRKDIIGAIKSTMDIDEDPDDFIQWIDENLPLVFTKITDLNKGYHYLSRASLYLARVGKRQDYNMWKFAGAMMTGGIVVSHSNYQTVNFHVNYPSIRYKLRDTKNMREIRDSIAKKISIYCHVSVDYARSKLINFFKVMMMDDEYANSISALLGLESEEIAFMVESEQEEFKFNKSDDTSDKKIELNNVKTTSNENNNNNGKSSKSTKSPQSSLFDF